ncbi:MAG: HlyD family efflux transporter periplasmic adaptor subunit [Burkholderiaceae bacterium]|jgi:HlyD family secretion protein|nr:HlyD family efflux transporter periplasmic adaptor subunit [Burkholderiaceae bacterium]
MLSKKKTLLLLVALALVAVGAWVWRSSQPAAVGEGFVSGNGRIEATEVDVATKMAGRVEEILAAEGDFVQVGQVLARMQIDALTAQVREARAMHRQALTGVAQAQAQVAARQSDGAAARAQVVQRESDLDSARRRLARSEILAQKGASPIQELDDDRARMRNAQAAVDAAKAQVAAADAAVQAAEANRVGAEASAKAAAATVERIDADLADSDLRAPRDGRVQLRLAQPGEVLGAGGRVLNLVDLSDVYMTFFVPESVAGRLALGAEVRVVLDVAPQFAVPARVSFVADTAQFTPKTVETVSERQKLMFRVRARIDEALLKSRLAQVKTGLPGVAWVRLDEQQPWPPQLSRLVPTAQ